MRVKAITPIRVGDAELSRRQERYRALAPASLDVVLFDLSQDDGVPESLDSEAAIRASERFVIEEALATDPEAYDAVLPDCVLDSGLDTLQRESPVPAFGILQLSAGFLSALGLWFASVTRNRPIGDELRSRLLGYGYATRFDGNVVLDLDFTDVANDARWNEALAGVLGRFEGSSTKAVINGCSAVELGDREPGGLALVDPTGLALRILDDADDAELLPLPAGAAAPGGPR
jgi:Asp/Glu/hydantoin racemase